MNPQNNINPIKNIILNDPNNSGIIIPINLNRNNNAIETNNMNNNNNIEDDYIN